MVNSRFFTYVELKSPVPFRLFGPEGAMRNLETGLPFSFACSPSKQVGTALASPEQICTTSVHCRGHGHCPKPKRGQAGKAYTFGKQYASPALGGQKNGVGPALPGNSGL